MCKTKERSVSRSRSLETISKKLTFLVKGDASRSRAHQQQETPNDAHELPEGISGEAVDVAELPPVVSEDVEDRKKTDDAY